MHPIHVKILTMCMFCVIRRLSWCDSLGHGFSLEYPSISLHAICRDTSQFPHECIYCMMESPLDGMNLLLSTLFIFLEDLDIRIAFWIIAQCCKSCLNLVPISEMMAHICYGFYLNWSSCLCSSLAGMCCWLENREKICQGLCSFQYWLFKLLQTHCDEIITAFQIMRMMVPVMTALAELERSDLCLRTSQSVRSL